MASFGNEDVRWFDVAMDDAFRVRGVQPLSHLYRNLTWWFRVLPSRYSLTMKALTFSSPMS